MEEHLSSWQVVAAALIFYGVVFIVVETVRARRIARGSAVGSGLPSGAHFADEPPENPDDPPEFEYEVELLIVDEVCDIIPIIIP